MFGLDCVCGFSFLIASFLGRATGDRKALCCCPKVFLCLSVSTFIPILKLLLVLGSLVELEEAFSF